MPLQDAVGQLFFPASEEATGRQKKIRDRARAWKWIELIDLKAVMAPSPRSAPRPADRAPGTMALMLSVEDAGALRWNEVSKLGQTSISLEKGASESINSSHFSCLCPAFFQ